MDNLFKFTKTAGPKLQNEINKSVIYNYLRENGPISRIKISKDLKISAPSVSRTVCKLIEDDYVMETRKEKTKKGKWPMLLKINEKKGFVIGIDLGKERLKMAMANFNCEIIKKHDGFKIYDDEKIIKKLILEIEKFIQETEIMPRAVSIGIPAVVDIDSGKISRASLYGSWKDLNLKKILKNKFDLSIFVENDVKFSAIGEKNCGAGKNYRNILFIEISNGIGTGIIINNNLIRGSNGSAGEIGFSIASPTNLGFNIKNKGFLEKYASVEGLKKNAVKMIKEGKKTLINNMIEYDINKVEPNIICRAAIEGDALSVKLIDEMTSLLAVSIINLILAIDPQIVFIGGDILWLPHSKELFLEPITAKVRRSAPFDIPQLKIPSLGEDAGIVGACYMALESIISDTFPYKIEKEVFS